MVYRHTENYDIDIWMFGHGDVHIPANGDVDIHPSIADTINSMAGRPVLVVAPPAEPSEPAAAKVKKGKKKDEESFDEADDI